MANYKYKEKTKKQMKMRTKVGPGNKRQVSVGCKNYAISNRGNWNHFRIIQKMSGTTFGKHDIKALQETAIWALRTYCGK
jgi:protein-disulfide isomerase-like protein with CxxC motif